MFDFSLLKNFTFLLLAFSGVCVFTGVFLWWRFEWCDGGWGKGVEKDNVGVVRIVWCEMNLRGVRLMCWEGGGVG